jgi:hypothetical protein
MNQLENKNLRELLEEFLEVHYSGSFARMVSEYIRATGMTETEREALLEAVRREFANYKEL